MADPTPKLDPQAVRSYFSRPGTVSGWWHPESGPLEFHYEAELRVLDDHLEIDPAWRVLDVGTGRGRFGIHFALRGCRVVGVDLSPEMLEIARRAARERGVEDRYRAEAGSAEDLSGFDANGFDVVLCMELFDHLPDVAAVLRSVRARLAPGGRLFFTYVPSESIYGALGNVYRFARTRMGSGESLISRTYSLAEIRSRLAAADLRLERYWGVGLACVNAQTRLFGESRLLRALTALARAEARRWPYHDRPWLARHAAHVVGLARPL